MKHKVTDFCSRRMLKRLRIYDSIEVVKSNRLPNGNQLDLQRNSNEDYYRIVLYSPEGDNPILDEILIKGNSIEERDSSLTNKFVEINNQSYDLDLSNIELLYYNLVESFK